MNYWTQIPGFENYEISQCGKIRRGNKILKKRYRNGYIVYCLRKCGKTVYKLAHRLVALSFLSNPQDYKEVNHIDGNKLNNYYTNLEWCSRKQTNSRANTISCQTTIQI